MLEETNAFAVEMLTVLETAEWTHDGLDAVLRALGTEKEWSVKETFMLLRAVLTGSTMSPPLLESLVVFGKARSLDPVSAVCGCAEEGLGSSLPPPLFWIKSSKDWS